MDLDKSNVMIISDSDPTVKSEAADESIYDIDTSMEDSGTSDDKNRLDILK
jgi:hypothetical protein